MYKLITQIFEDTYNKILRKQSSIGRLFPNFSDRVKNVAQKGGVKLIDMQPEVWHFKVNSASKDGVRYDNYVRFKNIPEVLGKWVFNRTLWLSDESHVDYRKLAAEVMNEVDLEIDCSCLVGDTKIPLLDGRVLTISEITKEYGDKSFWIYSSDENGDFVPAKAISLGITKNVDKLVEVTLDNEKTVRCTPEHLFRLRDGSYKEAQYLTEGESLMPLYTKLEKPNKKYSQSYLWVKLNSKVGKKERSIWKTVHRVVAETLLIEQKQKKVEEIDIKKEKGLIVHHIDVNSQNNVPENLKWLGVYEHWMRHAKYDKNNRIEGTKKYHKDPENKIKIKQTRSKAGKIGGLKAKEKGVGFFSKESRHKAAVNRNKTYWSNPENKIKQSLKLKGHIGNHNPKSIETKIKMRISALKRWENSEYKEKQFKNRDPKTGKFNHKVISIKFIKMQETIPVYDLSVEKYQNFALDAGVYVHNCPADKYYGGEFIKTARNSQYGDKETRPPVKRNPKQYGIMCKHSQLMFDVLPFYVSTFSSYLKKFWKPEIDKLEIKFKEQLQGMKKATKTLAKKEEEIKPLARKGKLPPEVENPEQETSTALKPITK